MKILFVKKEYNLTENPLEDDNIIYKEDYSSIIIFLKVIVASFYAFGLGYSLFYLGDDILKTGVLFLALLIITYTFIDYPYTLIKALFLPKVFKKDNIRLNIKLLVMSVEISSKKAISKVRIIFSLIIPCILLGVIPTVASYLLEFNIYFYVLASSIAIISIKDIIYLFLILKNYSKGDLIKLDIDKFIFYSN